MRLVTAALVGIGVALWFVYVLDCNSPLRLRVCSGRLGWVCLYRSCDAQCPSPHPTPVPPTPTPPPATPQVPYGYSDVSDLGSYLVDTDSSPVIYEGRLTSLVIRFNDPILLFASDCQHLNLSAPWVSHLAVATLNTDHQMLFCSRPFRAPGVHVTYLSLHSRPWGDPGPVCPPPRPPCNDPEPCPTCPPHTCPPVECPTPAPCPTPSPCPACPTPEPCPTCPACPVCPECPPPRPPCPACPTPAPCPSGIDLSPCRGHVEYLDTPEDILPRNWRAVGAYHPGNALCRASDGSRTVWFDAEKSPAAGVDGGRCPVGDNGEYLPAHQYLPTSVEWCALNKTFRAWSSCDKYHSLPILAPLCSQCAYGWGCCH